MCACVCVCVCAVTIQRKGGWQGVSKSLSKLVCLFGWLSVCSRCSMQPINECNVVFHVCQKYLHKNMYILNRFETNCRNSMIPFNAIWGLCWLIFFVSRSTQAQKI